MSLIIVAGGLGALGRVVAEQLSSEGHIIAIVDFADGEAPESGAATVIGACDLTDEAAVAEAYRIVAERHGAIDGLVNVAGGFLWELVEDGSVESWDRMYNMNLRTAVVSSRAALPLLAAGASIVNVGAAATANPGSGMAPYVASKAGVAAFTQSLAEELRSRKVRVNAILPTIIDTPANRAEMPDADRSDWVDPADAANVVAYLLSPKSSCVTGELVRLSLGR